MSKPALVNQHILKRVTVPINSLDITELGERHIAGALALSEEAHWNQVEADWRMMMSAGNAIGMVDPEGRLVASAMTLPYGDRFGWISMVLVTADWQKKGVATRLLRSCIERLESLNLTPVLDATQEGENVYRPLGFMPKFGIQRWHHEAVENITLENASEHDLAPVTEAAVFRNDANIFGGDRRVVLASLVARSTAFSCLDEDYGGYLLGRDGRVATQIGPIFTNNSASALAMLDHALAKISGPVFIDACNHQLDFVARLESYGFTPQRPFLRMAKGQGGHRNEVEHMDIGEPAKMFATAGPELG